MHPQRGRPSEAAGWHLGVCGSLIALFSEPLRDLVVVVGMLKDVVHPEQHTEGCQG